MELASHLAAFAELSNDGRRCRKPLYDTYTRTPVHAYTRAPCITG